MTLMPGRTIIGGAGASGGGGAKTLVFQSQSESVNNGTITTPSDVEPDDLMFLFQKSVNGASAPSSVTPPGWGTVGSAFLNAAGTSTRIHISQKIAVSTDASKNYTGMDDTEDIKLILVFRPNFTVVSLTDFDFAGQVTNANPSSQTANASGGTPPLIVFGVYSELNAGSGDLTSRSLSPAEDGEKDTLAATGFNQENIWVKFKIYNEGDTPQNHTINMNDEGAKNCLASFYAEVAF